MPELPDSIADVSPGQVVWLGIPHDENSSFVRGAADGPQAVRRVIEGDSANMCTESGVDLSQDNRLLDLGDLTIGEGVEEYLGIEQSVARVLQTNCHLISIGGDHAISFPIVKAHHAKYPHLRILQFDAHPDLYDNYNDNPYMHSCPFARIMEAGLCRKLVQVGIRTANPHQRKQAERFGVETIDMIDWERDRPACLSQINDALSGGPVYISLDLDVFDPAAAPGTAHHEPGGMMPRDVIQLLQQLDPSLDVVGADIVELNPRRDHHDMTAMLAYKMLKELTDRMV